MDDIQTALSLVEEEEGGGESEWLEEARRAAAALTKDLEQWEVVRRLSPFSLLFPLSLYLLFPPTCPSYPSIN